MENIDVPADNCPVAPAPQVTIYTRVLHRACQMLGGVEALAAKLRVPAPTLVRWLDGEGEPPTPIFLRAVDIVMPSWNDEDELFASTLRAQQRKKPD